MDVMGAAENVNAEVKHLVNEFVRSGGGNTLAGIGLMARSLTGKEANTEELDRMRKLYDHLNPANRTRVLS